MKFHQKSAFGSLLTSKSSNTKRWGKREIGEREWQRESREREIKNKRRDGGRKKEGKKVGREGKERMGDNNRENKQN